METTLCVTCGARRAQVLCRFKRIKNVHLRVYPDGRVILSAPARTGLDWIQSYLESKAAWIFRAAEKYGRAEKPEKGVCCLLGTPRRIVAESGPSRTELTPDELRVRLPSPDEAGVMRRVEKFVRERALETFCARVEKWYPVVQARGAPYPEISVRRMKSMWGNCNTAKGTIRFNTVLLCADEACIDYVVLHELTHLLIAGHQENFYRFLAAAMPDWKQRKTRLNRLYSKYL